MADNDKRSSPLWVRIILILVGIVVSAFLLWLLAASFRQSTRSDQQRVRELEIAADYLATWPEVARQIGRSNLFHTGQSGRVNWGSDPVARLKLYHPDFGDFVVNYRKDLPRCRPDMVIANDELTVFGVALAGQPVDGEDGRYLTRARTRSWAGVPAVGNPICFRVGPIKLRTIVQESGRFRHMLLIKQIDQGTGAKKSNDKGSEKPPAGMSDLSAQIGGTRLSMQVRDAPKNERVDDPWIAPRKEDIEPDGSVIAQIGATRLPIRNLSDLPKVESGLEAIAVSTARATLEPGKPATAAPRPPRDALEPINSTVAGHRYRFYPRPVDFGSEGESQAATYFLVGAARADEQRSASDSGVQVIVFTILLALLVSLVPVVKLAKLGPIDTLTPIETAAVAFGLITAVAVATGGWIAARDVVEDRAQALATLRHETAAIEGNIVRELRAAIVNNRVRGQSLSAPGLAPGPSAMIDGKADGQPSLPQPDAVFFVDRNGRQPPGEAIRVARDQAGADYNLADRQYFKRALAGDGVDGSEAWLDLIKHHWGGRWKDATGPLLIDNVRSKPDGAPRTILAAALRSETGSSDPEYPDYRAGASPAVIASSLVLRSMLAPALPVGHHYAVIDSRENGMPVLFHSEQGRIHIQRFLEGVDRSTAETLRNLPKHNTKDDTKCFDAAPTAITFQGRHEDMATLFAATRLRCSDWIVLTWQARNQVDRQAVQASLHAVLIWTAFAIMVMAGWAILALSAGDWTWCWLWPDPRQAKQHAVHQTIIVMLGATISAAVLMIWLPALAALVGVVGAAIGLAPLAMAQRRMQRRRQHAEEETAHDAWAGREKLDRRTELRFMLVFGLALLLLAAIPIVGLADDARRYLVQLNAGADVEAVNEARRLGERREQAILWAFSRDQYLAHGRPAGPVPLTLGTCTPVSSAQEDTFVARVRGQLEWDKGACLHDPGEPPEAGLRAFTWFWLVVLGGILLMVIARAFFATMRGLFGFGVALEAIDYPPLPGLLNESGVFAVDREGLPDRFMVIAAPDAQRRALLDAARTSGEVCDLFAQYDTPLSQLQVPVPRAGQKPIVLFNNLGTLLRDPLRRRKALHLMEWFVERQGRPAQFVIGLVTELSPLDRLFHSYEREAEDLKDLTPGRRLAIQRNWARHREDMRWSRLFEEFTTYIYSAGARSQPNVFGRRSRTAQAVLGELEYVPDHAVAALIPDREPPLYAREIVRWAAKTFHRDKRTGERASPDAIVDYLWSMLIEHYQHIWTVSTRAERLLLHRFAHHHIPNLGNADPIRSLIRRGLVVLDPYPRIMNRSFARFVRHVEKESTIDQWRKGAEHGGWSGLRWPITLGVPLAIGVLIYFSIRNGDSYASLLPLLAAAGPALVQAFGAGKRMATT